MARLPLHLRILYALEPTLQETSTVVRALFGNCGCISTMHAWPFHSVKQKYEFILALSLVWSTVCVYTDIIIVHSQNKKRAGLGACLWICYLLHRIVETLAAILPARLSVVKALVLLFRCPATHRAVAVGRAAKGGLAWLGHTSQLQVTLQCVEAIWWGYSHSQQSKMSHGQEPRNPYLICNGFQNPKSSFHFSGQHGDLQILGWFPKLLWIIICSLSLCQW